MGWEALCKGKNILVFGHAWFKDFPGVIKFHEKLTYKEIIKQKPDEKLILSKFQSLMALSHDGVIDRAYTNLVTNFDIDINNKKTADTISRLILRKEKVTFLKT